MKISKKLVSPILMWTIVFVGLMAIFQLVPARYVFPKSNFSNFLIVPAVIYWVYFFGGALKVHRKAALSVDRINKIVTNGVYAKVRHPIYAADIFLGWGIFFAHPDVRFLLGAHLLMFVLLFWIRLEEKALTEKFGQDYSEYVKKVPKLFPFL
jgi:protein-S-isoprenylcysteine O-methyltransferase Ste14